MGEITALSQLGLGFFVPKNESDTITASSRKPTELLEFYSRNKNGNLTKHA